MSLGLHEPGAFAAATFAKAFDVDLDYLLGLSAQASQTRIEALSAKPSEALAESVAIPFFDAEAAAGSGRLPDAREPSRTFPFPRAWIERLGGEPAHIQALRAQGDSMFPTIADGALLLVDYSKIKLPRTRTKARFVRSRYASDDIYVFYQRDDGLRVKRLQRLSAGFTALISDNPDFGTEIWPDAKMEAVKLIGRVIWWDNRL